MSSMLDEIGKVAFGQIVFGSFVSRNARQRKQAAQFGQELSQLGFHNSFVAFGLSSLQDLPANRDRYFDQHILPADKLGHACRLFLLNIVMAEGIIRTLFSSETCRFLADMGVLVEREDGWQSQVSIFPYEGFLLTTDSWRYDAVWPAEIRGADRVMYVGRDSVGLAAIASRKPAGRTLDLCCGSGIQSLVASTYSSSVIGVDINPRALRFAEFNAAMNSIENVEFRCGDLFAPVADINFDAIVANPPFVAFPETSQPLLFRTGGETGEHILSRILSHAGAQERSRLTLACDLFNVEGFPDKLSQWQGYRRETLLLIENEVPLVNYAEDHTGFLDSKRACLVASLRMYEHLVALGINTVHFGYILQNTRRGDCTTHHLRMPPIAPVHAEVDALMQLHRCLHNGIDDVSVLYISEGARILLEIAQDRDGDSLTRIELDMPGSTVLAPIEIPPPAHPLLTRLRVEAVTYATACQICDSATVNDLIRLGYIGVKGNVG